MASFKVNFRVVGLYCYYENIDLGELYGLTPKNTMQDIMDKLQEHTNFQFNYQHASLDDGKDIAISMEYNFDNNSQVPPNTQYTNKGRPDNKKRGLNMLIQNQGTSFLWQYYRSVTGILKGKPYTVKLSSLDNKTSFTKRNWTNNWNSQDLILPEGFEPTTYNLTWRLVAVTLSPDKAGDFMQAQNNAATRKG